MYSVEYDGEMYDVSLYVGEYRNNGRLAIILIDGEGEDFADLTVNLSDERCPEGCAFLDTNNLPSAEDFVERNGLGEFTGYWGHSGFCSYPMYRFDTERIGKVTSESPRNGRYRVEHFSGIRWKRVAEFENEGDAEVCMDDRYYADRRKGDRFSRYRIREVRGRA